jgi:DNA-binding MarR family transcriptional regulator
VSPVPSVPSSSAGAPAEEGGARLLTDHIVRFVRLIQVARSRFALSAGHERDRAAYLVLQAIDRLAPVRQRSLAEVLRAEPSTLSRHVSFLTDKGLIRRMPDDRDGRACLLELTTSGTALIEELRHWRESSVASMLADWTSSDRAEFTRLLGRFVENLAEFVDGGNADSTDIHTGGLSPYSADNRRPSATTT